MSPSLKAQKSFEKESSNMQNLRNNRQRDPRPVYLYMVQGVGFEPSTYWRHHP